MTHQAGPPYAILPGIGIGPLRLGMTEAAVDQICRDHGLRNEGAFRSGLHVAFHDGRATRIEFAADMGLSLAGETLIDTSNRNVRRLLESLAQPGPDWTEMDGLVVLHWELGDEFVFSFMVYAPGHRFPPAPAVITDR
jgi:hypothetical protein